MKDSETLEDLTGSYDKLEKRFDELITSGENISLTFERMKPRQQLMANLERRHKLKETDIISNIQIPCFHQEDLVIQKHSSTSSEDTDISPKQRNSMYNLRQRTPYPREAVSRQRKNMSATREATPRRRKSTDLKTTHWSITEVAPFFVVNVPCSIETALCHRRETMETPRRQTNVISGRGAIQMPLREASLSPESNQRTTAPSPKREITQSPPREIDQCHVEKATPSPTKGTTTPPSRKTPVSIKDVSLKKKRRHIRHRPF